MNRLLAAVSVGLLAAFPAQAFAAGPAAKPPVKSKSDERSGSREPAPTAAEAKAFAERVNKELKELGTEFNRADWVKSNFITSDTELLAAKANDRLLAFMAEAIKTAARFDKVDVDPETRRMLHLLKVSATLPAPSDPGRRLELTELAAKLEGTYGKGKYCKPAARGLDAGKRVEKGGKPGEQECRDLEDLSKVLRESRNYDEQLDAWRGWHAIAQEMRPMYQRFVELSNQGAREIGFADVGTLWRSAYDMSPEDFQAETDRLWSQVRPLYEQLRCYVQTKLGEKYGKDKVPPGGMLPAHLLGNMWAQEWNNIYDLVEPNKGQANLDVTAAMKAQKMTPQDVVRRAEDFFVSLGMDHLPETFWQRSLFSKPRDREVVCHASAWDITYDADLRIKMCIEINEEDLTTVHHELGHDYYFLAYHKLPALYQAAANDGFHEAIGDAIALSVTPSYLKQLGFLKAVPKNDKNLINLQMKDALEKVSFLPFGLLIDRWRWDVFSGKIPPNRYNAAWWELRRKYQGIDAPIARSEADFDPGAKYHIPANTPYTRYFLARILQFQFHQAMCKAAGFTGPLHECSIYGNKAAGTRLQAMLAMGASRPWPDALEALTGTRKMDATPLIEYFRPLLGWLEQQNAGKSCGWNP